MSDLVKNPKIGFLAIALDKHGTWCDNPEGYPRDFGVILAHIFFFKRSIYQFSRVVNAMVLKATIG